MITGRSRHGGCQAGLQLLPEGLDYFDVQIFLPGEVVNDDAVAGAEMFSDATEAELAETLLAGNGKGTFEQLGLGVFMAHGCLSL